ncbi:MAG: hypothetical protein FJ405_01575 [Verrucomicrobia bacterium]|nr:hypothetical protein [Verrucomicrobiota bacterium]
MSLLSFRYAAVICAAWVASPVHGDSLTLSPKPGKIEYRGAFNRGVVTLEGAHDVAGPWTPLKNQFTLSPVGSMALPSDSGQRFFRMVASPLHGGAEEFETILQSYGLLSTLAGAGGARNDSNKWRPEFEGTPGTEVLLSNPHMAMADRDGNIFIADKQGHAIRKLDPSGIITTVAGTGSAGNGPDWDSDALSVELNAPNGLYVRWDGTVYVLDTGNNRVRRLDPSGRIRTLFTVSAGLKDGRGLWVRTDERLAFVCASDKVRMWTPERGVRTFSEGYTELGNLTVDPAGNLVVTDRGAHRVYRLDASGVPTVIAGNGEPFGGGDGSLAIETGLQEVRGVAFLPTGGYFLATHRGSQIWYVDTDNIIHLFLNGVRRSFPRGDGTYFYNLDEFRVSEVRAVTVDWQGNLLITENDAGYIRKVHFLPFIPPAE